MDVNNTNQKYLQARDGITHVITTIMEFKEYLQKNGMDILLYQYDSSSSFRDNGGFTGNTHLIAKTDDKLISILADMLYHELVGRYHIVISISIKNVTMGNIPLELNLSNDMGECCPSKFELRAILETAETLLDLQGDL